MIQKCLGVWICFAKMFDFASNTRFFFNLQKNLPMCAVVNFERSCCDGNKKVWRTLFRYLHIKTLWWLWNRIQSWIKSWLHRFPFDKKDRRRQTPGKCACKIESQDNSENNHFFCRCPVTSGNNFTLFLYICLLQRRNKTVNCSQPEHLNCKLLGLISSSNCGNSWYSMKLYNFLYLSCVSWEGRQLVMSKKKAQHMPNFVSVKKSSLWDLLQNTAIINQFDHPFRPCRSVFTTGYLDYCWTM